MIKAEIGSLGKFAVFSKDGGEPKQVLLTDINGHWGQAWIEKAAQLGIIQGYSDHTFQPNKTVSRQEMVYMLVHALKPSNEATASDFADQKQIGVWAATEVAAAVGEGWVTGFGDGNFRPQANMTRAEVTAIIVRAMNLPVKQNSNGNTGFSDNESIPAWVKGYAAAAAENGLIEGRGGNRFAAEGIVTRAEAAVIIVRLLEMNEKLRQ